MLHQATLLIRIQRRSTNKTLPKTENLSQGLSIYRKECQIRNTRNQNYKSVSQPYQCADLLERLSYLSGDADGPEWKLLRNIHFKKQETEEEEEYG